MRFSELVRHEGNESLFRAIEMSTLSTALGLPFHVHVEGLRGTGKTTIMRAVRAVLPSIRRIRGCAYNCLPEAPHCPQHIGMDPDAIAQIGVEEIPMPFLEISHSAKIGTVVGSIDLARITDRGKPQAAILPGTIPQANRGIIFVDEINRLAEVAPELADVLLSVMGTKPGFIQIEETGLPTIEMPISLSVWAASNPDEDPGPLEDVRRQLADRFDVSVNMSRPTSVSQVISILRKGSGSRPASRDDAFQQLMQASRGRDVAVPAEIEEMVARLYLDYGLESLRAVESLLHGSRMRAMIKGRDQLTVADVQDVVTLCLRHRVDMNQLNQILSYLHGLGEKREVAGQSSDGPSGHNDTRRPDGPQSDRGAAGDTHDRQAGDALSRLFARLKDALAMTGSTPGRTTNGQPGTGAPGAGTTKQGASACNSRSSGGMSSQIADPLKSPLSAPETLAVPIGMLPLSDIITSAEDLMHAGRDPWLD